VQEMVTGIVHGVFVACDRPCGGKDEQGSR